MKTRGIYHRTSAQWSRCVVLYCTGDDSFQLTYRRMARRLVPRVLQRPIFCTRQGLCPIARQLDRSEDLHWNTVRIMLPRFRFSIDILVRLAEQTLEAQKYSLNIVDGTPFLFEDVQTYTSGEVDIGMVQWSDEEDGGCLVGIVVGKLKG